MNTMTALLQAARLAFDDVVRQLVPVALLTRKMLAEKRADALDPFNQRIREGFALEVIPHRLDQPIPKLDAAFLVNAFVTDDGELPRARRNQDEHGVPLSCLSHRELVELLRRERERLVLDFAAL